MITRKPDKQEFIELLRFEAELAEFEREMLRQRQAHWLPENWNAWEPSEEELELMMSKAWIQLKQKKAVGNTDGVRQLAAHLGFYALKAFQLYGKK